VRCPACGQENIGGKRFCVQCGASLELVCARCGERCDPADRFCGACGATLREVAAKPSGSERRLVSVLFADLVGFTTMSEHRDPEDVRALLSRYFDRCRSVIERHGGTVEKFIGDAVMAVWGTPVAREDDAERAVRSALALTAAIPVLADEVQMPELAVRVGVLTGTAAVEVGAEREGMVLGDTVNTAARVQSIAQPNTVLVDDVTRRASEAAIAYEDAGEHHVKGREAPVRCWTALRVIAGAGGARRSAGLEAQFVGRGAELQAVLDAAAQSARERRARLVTVIGDAGYGKSRLLWELFKHVDGLGEASWWHQGRCLSYGDGVAHWALAEMIRGRAGIAEDEEQSSAREKLHATVCEHVADERERRLVEPRLAHLLGLEQRVAPDRADLFSGWRLFIERLSETHPVVLVFEDLQWADSGLLDFIDYLLEWSAEHPIVVVALGRPSLLGARPSWAPAVALDRLSDADITAMLESLVPGLPEDLAERIRRRADGVPLYAIETLRMLLDRGQLRQDGNEYVLTGALGDLDVPETLHALLAARLDDLEPDERSLLGDAAVIGQSFTAAMLTAVVAFPAAAVAELLAALVSKQVLTHVDDARLAEHGQHAFLQPLLRDVALSTLPRRTRKARHLAVARQLEESRGEDGGELAEVVASHYLDAVAVEPDAADAPEIRAQAGRMLEDAGRRALSLASGAQARKHFERAAELAHEPAQCGRLLFEAGMAAELDSQPEDAVALLDRASELLAEARLPREAAKAEGAIASLLLDLNRAEEASVRLERVYAEIDDGSDDEVVAELAFRRATLAYTAGRPEEALPLVDRALAIGERRRLVQTVVRALQGKGLILRALGRIEEPTALLTRAVELALEHDLSRDAVIVYFNLAEFVISAARFDEAEALLDRGLALARERGDRRMERWMLAQSFQVLFALGRWAEARERSERVRADGDDMFGGYVLSLSPYLLAALGDVERLSELLEPLEALSGWRESELAGAVGRAIALREIGRVTEGVDLARDAVLERLESPTSEGAQMFAEAVECALAAGRPDVARALVARVETLSPVELLPLLGAEAVRARARLLALDGDQAAAEREFRRAIELFGSLGTPFYLARVQLECAELIMSAELRAQAAATFGSLGARGWLERANTLEPAVP
jgi:class 3 adenylate cyclase/tetratricopeptide (TPR) repeat protein